MKENAIGVIYPEVDLDICVSCHACEKVCPILHPVEYYGTSRCYAAWNTDKKERKHSASGGIASAIYKEVIDTDVVAIGASLNPDWSVTHKIATTQEELQPFKNSKYVFSSAYEVFPEVKKLLKEGKEVVMIGLPCQIAAMKKLFGTHDNLLLIDLVCHGTTPVKYLRQHIKHIESSLGKKAAALSFRAPEKGTANYYFTLYDSVGDIVYAKKSIDGDTYNIAFHRMISYRENCFHCCFARPERVSDITLGDYHGLGKVTPCKYTEDKVSVILTHTIKGEEMINRLVDKRLIHVERRPVEEPIAGDAQLRRPSPKGITRIDFERYITASQGDFERSIQCVLRNIRRRELKENLFSYPRRAVLKVLRILKLK